MFDDFLREDKIMDFIEARTAPDGQVLSCDDLKKKAETGYPVAYFSGKDGLGAQVFIDLMKKTTSTFARVEEEGCAASLGHKDGEIVMLKPEGGEHAVFTGDLSVDNILEWF